MSDLNSEHNRVVWVDVPVVQLERASAFYTAVLGVPVHLQQFGQMRFSVLDHAQGNGGCLVEKGDEVSSDKGILVYFNVDKRIRAAVSEVDKHGGKVLQPIHSIGPHGFRAIVCDSEGNRIALHSNTDS